MSYKTLNGKVLIDTNPDEYVNVKTARKITDLHKKGFFYEEIDGNYVCGLREDLDEFYELNKKSGSKNTKSPAAHSNTVFKKANETFERTNRNTKSPERVPPKRGITKQKTLNTEDFSNINIERDVNFCDINTAGTSLFIPQTDDVEDVPNEIINKMCVFELNGLKGKAKVTEILDADTINILFFVKISELITEREKGRAKGRGADKKKETFVPVISKHLNAGFFTLFNCRLLGIDAAEHDTINGQLATLLLEDYFETLNDIIYVKVSDFDKYGRMMPLIYSDKTYKNLINDKLLDLKIEELPELYSELDIDYDSSKLDEEDLKIICLPYDGKTKDIRFKSLPKVAANTINRQEHGYLLEKYKIY